MLALAQGKKLSGACLICPWLSTHKPSEFISRPMVFRPPPSIGAKRIRWCRSELLHARLYVAAAPGLGGGGEGVGGGDGGGRGRGVGGGAPGYGTPHLSSSVQLQFHGQASTPRVRSVWVMARK
jgi:hypothetical protein